MKSRLWVILLVVMLMVLWPAQLALADTTYTVQPGDTLSSIAHTFGVTVDAIVQANNIADPNFVVSGQVLTIPGVDGPVNAETTTPAPATASANLLPNPSFEEDWYFYNGVPEWQLPNGWMLFVDEGPNTLAPGSGGNFLRPEVRVVATTNLPPAEHEQFIFDGTRTLKSFKGGAPTSFAIFTDVHLQPGTYRFTIHFFPDIVVAYDQGRKVWAGDPLAAGVRFIHDNGGTDWMPVTTGTKNTLTYDFAVSNAGPVRLGAAFRNRFVQQNNGWFLDDWSLQALATP